MVNFTAIRPILRQKSQHSRLPVVGIFLAVTVVMSNLAIVSFIHEEWLKNRLMDLGYPVWYLLAATALFYAAHQSVRRSRHLFLAWGLLGFAELFLAFGSFTRIVLELKWQVKPFPSIADGFYLLFYPLFQAGIVLLPARRLTTAERWKIALDMGIVLLAATLTLWQFWIGPLATSIGQESRIVRFVALAYPVEDLVLISAFLVLLYRPLERVRPRILALLVIGTGMLILADCNYGYQSLLGSFTDGSPLGFGRIMSSVIYALAGIGQAVDAQRTQRGLAKSPSRPITISLSWSCLTYFPSLWIVTAYLLLIHSYYYETALDFMWHAVGVGGIIGFALIRQVITAKENTSLLLQVQQANEQILQQSMALQQSNHSLLHEIEERKRVQEQLAHDALHDALTGLPNRALFLMRLHRALEQANLYAHYHFSVLFLDLDQFKVVNDSLGHLIGDQLLIALAARLQTCVRATDTVARLGGDEFVILLENTNEFYDPAKTAERIQEALQIPFTLDNHQLVIAASIGMVIDAKTYMRAEDILRDADLAMYRAKVLGKARSELFSVSMRTDAIARLELESDLRAAVERHELELYYQPILGLRSKNIYGVEALLRWRHPTRGLLTPDAFMAVAEETSLILPIGQWVLCEACRQLKEWQVHFPQVDLLTINVNVSVKQLLASDFVAQVERALGTVGLPGASLKLEITEGIYLHDSGGIKRIFNALRQCGVQFHLDDFGTGYSSLSYLQLFPLQALKIDREFVSKLGEQANNRDIVRAIVVMAHGLGMDTVAEGIETVTQLHELQELGCNYGQGYLLGRPMDSNGIEKLLQELVTDSPVSRTDI